MIKTFEQFSGKQLVYTPEEYQTVLDIVSSYYDENDPNYYDGDSIEEFIYSSDIDAKEDFVDENEISKKVYEVIEITQKKLVELLEMSLMRYSRPVLANEILREFYSDLLDLH